VYFDIYTIFAFTDYLEMFELTVPNLSAQLPFMIELDVSTVVYRKMTSREFV